jgi:hypothetical protein
MAVLDPTRVVAFLLGGEIAKRIGTLRPDVEGFL